MNPTFLEQNPSLMDLSCVSPSSVGDYAGCPMKLVLDTDFPQPYTTNEYADFGTLCHFEAMRMMGLNPPPVKDRENVEMTAVKLYRGNLERLTAGVKAASELAVARVPKLPPGVHWVAETRKHDPKLLPSRLSRNGSQGYGGVIDLMALDRSIILDFKFTGKPPAYVKQAYLWQMASYHLLTGITKTVLLFVSRDAKWVTTCTLDFSQPIWRRFAEGVRGFIQSCGHADYRRQAYFRPGESCEWCKHKESNRCPCKQMPPLVEYICGTEYKQNDEAMDLINMAESLEAPVAPAAPVLAFPVPSTDKIPMDVVKPEPEPAPIPWAPPPKPYSDPVSISTVVPNTVKRKPLF